MIILLIISIFIVLVAVLTVALIYVKPPKVNKIDLKYFNVTKISDNIYSINKSWINKNENKIFELFVEGSDFKRGYTIGKLTKQLFEKQEQIFIDELRKRMPNTFLRFVIKIAIGLLNRKIDKHIGDEFSKEIYGISLSASKKFNYLAPSYLRILNYHAAHDIGHALQDSKYVGCTAFSVKNSLSENGNLLIGRNFDFYINDEFCENKIIAFYNPEFGNKFAMITWAGMAGAVSGMNIKGLTLTLNGAKSDLPKKAATPISIVARKILQYANNIKDAIKIADSYNIFVSESIMVSSASDNMSVVIEKTPTKTDVYSSENDYLICTNHFQSKLLKDEKNNVENIKQSSSLYRYNRVKQLINEHSPLNVNKISEILRDVKGLNNTDIGIGNEKAINQIIAHHSVIFDPKNLIIYLSEVPYNLGKFVAYDLNFVFSESFNITQQKANNVILNLPESDVITNGIYSKYTEFKKIINIINNQKLSIESEKQLFKKLVELNPEYHLTYTTIADYLYKNKRFTEAKEWYISSMSKEFYHEIEKQRVINQIKNCDKKNIME